MEMKGSEFGTEQDISSKMQSISNWEESIIPKDKNIFGRQGKLYLAISWGTDDAGYWGHWPISEDTYFQRGYSQFGRNWKAISGFMLSDLMFIKSLEVWFR